MRIDKKSRRVTFECWPRFAEINDGDRAQFPGWPITIDIADNDGRKPVAWLPELRFEGVTNPVVQVIEAKTGAVLYTLRVSGDRFQPPVFAPGTYNVRVGRDRPDGKTLEKLESRAQKSNAGERTVRFDPPAGP